MGLMKKLFLYIFLGLFFSSLAFGFEVKDLIGKSLQFKFKSQTYKFDFYKTGEIISEIYDKPLKYTYKELPTGEAIIWEIINSKNLREGNRGFFIKNFNELIYATLEAKQNAEWNNFIIEEYELNEIEDNETILLVIIKKLTDTIEDEEKKYRIDHNCFIDQYLILKNDQKKELINFYYHNAPWENKEKLSVYFDEYEEKITNTVKKEKKHYYEGGIDFNEIFIDDCVILK